MRTFIIKLFFFFNSQVEDKINQVDSFIDRFRANLVVNGQEPFREDEWKMIKIGDLSFKVSCHFIWNLIALFHVRNFFVSINGWYFIVVSLFKTCYNLTATVHFIRATVKWFSHINGPMSSVQHQNTGCRIRQTCWTQSSDSIPHLKASFVFS